MLTEIRDYIRTQFKDSNIDVRLETYKIFFKLSVRFKNEYEYMFHTIWTGEDLHDILKYLENLFHVIKPINYEKLKRVNQKFNQHISEGLAIFILNFNRKLRRLDTYNSTYYKRETNGDINEIHKEHWFIRHVSTLKSYQKVN